MNFVLTILVFGLIWTAITGSFTFANAVFGVAIGLIALWVIRSNIVRPKFLQRTRRAVSLALLFLWELALSAIRVSALVLTPNLKHKLSPAIIAFPLTAKTDAEITLLANLITLTPGTLSVDVSDDRKHLYVHAIQVDNKEALIRSIAEGFEKKVMEVFN